MFNSKGRRAARGHCLAPIHPPVDLLLIAAVVESQLGCAAGDPIEAAAAAALNRYAPIFDLFASCGGFANSDRSRPRALASIRRIRRSRASLLSCFSDLLLRGHFRALFPGACLVGGVRNTVVFRLYLFIIVQTLIN
jgi:hypothetical protein